MPMPTNSARRPPAAGFDSCAVPTLGSLVSLGSASPPDANAVVRTAAMTAPLWRPDMLACFQRFPSRWLFNRSKIPVWNPASC